MTHNLLKKLYKVSIDDIQCIYLLYTPRIYLMSYKIANSYNYKKTVRALYMI